jgi:hypothetical protein
MLLISQHFLVILTDGGSTLRQSQLEVYQLKTLGCCLVASFILASRKAFVSFRKKKKKKDIDMMHLTRLSPELNG